MADLIFTMVGYPKDVEEVYLGKNGLIKNAKSGQIFVDMTTSSPILAEKINKEFLKKEAYTLESPVTGGDIGAKNGSLTIFVGGAMNTYLKIKLKTLSLPFQKLFNILVLLVKGNTQNLVIKSLSRLL